MNILCGYNANIDSIYSIKGSELNELLSTFTKEEIVDSLSNPPGEITSIPEFLAGLISCMKDGSGGEWMIHEKAVYEWLKSNYFERSLLRMGGNMGIMANVLSQLGASKVVPNVVNPSRIQMSFFSGDGIFLPSSSYSSIDMESVDVSAAAEEFDEDPIHFVFDFKKGETFSLFGQDIVVPRENRFIATYDPLNSRLRINNEFADYATTHIREMDGALISGFHMLQLSYPDGSGYAEKLDNVCEQLRLWKQLNNNIHIHAEFGHFSIPDLAISVFSTIAPLVDSIGMNEDELSMLGSIHGMDARSIIGMDSFVILEAAIKVCDISGLKSLFVHTREFVMSISSLSINYQDEVKALEFGISCAAAFAASGKLESREFILDVASTIHESEFGRLQVGKLSDIPSLHQNDATCGIFKGYAICAIPTLICHEPISTVGLGDTISAATFLRRLELGK
ncbi:ADP-dependent glucokinase/phosphofructokinase [Methanolobus sp. ZRKC3]|uniref:ADP-dependent glucokinase/phosphofructokinase n=1 Tax=Methanolobus sp. ZRKC3 TaxID=3125786 RepID=UPI003252A809